MTTNTDLQSNYGTTAVKYPSLNGNSERHLDEHDDLNILISQMLDRLESTDPITLPKKHRSVRLFIGSLSNTFGQKNLYRILHLVDKGYAVQLLLFDPFSDVTSALGSDKLMRYFANEDVFRINEALINQRKTLPTQKLYEQRTELNTAVFLYEQLEKLSAHYRDGRVPPERQVQLRYTHVKTESPTFILGDRVVKGHFFYNDDPDHYPWICSFGDDALQNNVSDYFNLHFEKLWTEQSNHTVGRGSHSLLQRKRNVFIGYDRDIGTLRRVEKEITSAFLYPMLFETQEQQNDHIIDAVQKHQQYSNGAVFIMSNANGDGQARSNVVSEFGYWCRRCQSDEGLQQQLFSKTLLILENGIALSNWNLETLKSKHGVEIVRFSRDSYGNPSPTDWATAENAIKTLKVRIHGE